MNRQTEPAVGWGLRVDGHRPYIAYVFFSAKDGIHPTESYHRPVRVAIVPLAAARKAGLVGRTKKGAA